MSRKKYFVAVLLAFLIFGIIVLGLFWHMRSYVLVDLNFYPKHAQKLDLRDEEISIRHYEKILRRIPGCEVLWNIPFQETTLPHDTEEITVTQLTARDIRVLEYFGSLERVNGENCRDYQNLLALRKSRPDLTVRYYVILGSGCFSSEEQEITVGNLSEEEITLLECLPELRKVLCSGGSMESVSALQDYCKDNGLEFGISLGGEAVSPTEKQVTAGAITDEQISLLQFLPEMEQLHIRNPQASAENLLALRTSCPGVEITWEREVGGKLFAVNTEEIDLSDVEITDLQTLDQEMAYFPDTKTVFLGECGLDNETLAAQRDLVRDKYKLAWVVSCGNKLKTRTDAVTFMPVREKVFYFNDEEAYNLRYCEDMICIDIGHMSIHNIDFVEFMPNLEYLILAHTQLQYIEPIKHCKKLKFLELDWSPLKDLTPLKECTALEDLNLGNTFADFAPVAEMTWLKNLWMIDCSTRARYEMTQALPDTKVMVTGAATVANGWRDLDNYYAMRDLLGMHYMSW